MHPQPSHGEQDAVRASDAPGGVAHVWSEYRRDVERVLGLARSHLSMEVAWVSEFAGGEQTFSVVDDGGSGYGPREGTAIPLPETYCRRVVDGRLPPLVPDARAHPVTRELPITVEADIGAYVGFPIRSDDAVVGLLCCMDPHARRELEPGGTATMSMLAALLGDLLERSSRLSRKHDAVRSRIAAALGGRGLAMALQPIVATDTGRLVGVEALARFPVDGPAAWFADAETVGLRSALEGTTAALALDRLDELAPQTLLSLNLSPTLVAEGALESLLADVDPTRVVLEVTEHAAIPDYAALHRALAPHRSAGLQLAVDDAGAGYASFRHILNLRPDLIKMDISLVSGIDRDPAQQALAESMLTFAERSDAILLAEGVERVEELALLTSLGVPLVQGFLVGRPSLVPPPQTIVLPDVREGLPVG